MKKHLKRFLSLLLVLAMAMSLCTTGLAANEPDDPDERSTAVGLEMEDLDPATLHVKKLGEIEEEEDPAVEIAPISFGKIVRVSIFLDEPATLDAGYSIQGIGTNSSAISYRESLKREQAAVTAAIEQATGRTLDVKWNMTLAVNAISANVRYGDIVKIGAVDGVKRVVIENQYEAPVDAGTPADPNTANTSENMVGATAAWAAGYTGAGSRIAIIDTGIDTTHQSFAAEPFNYSIGLAGATDKLMTQAQVQALASQLNSKSGNYVSTKIPYGYNYVDENTTIDHMSDTQGEHGSHVAGIAAANRYIGNNHQDAATTVKAVGMAPDAQLFIMKVFGAKGGAYDSDYMVAIEDAIVLDCDAVNLSLGSAVQGTTFSDGYQEILNHLVDKTHNEGMVVSISAGNSYALTQFLGTDLYIDDVSMHTGGSPGTYVNSLCVAAAQNTLLSGTPMTFNGSQLVYYAESTKGSDGTAYSNPALATVKGSYDYIYIDATGSAEDYSSVNNALNLSGRVVIVNRGDLSFSEKGNNAKSYSPKAVIIANNARGTITMDLSDFTGTFPMVSITQKDANQIKADSTEHTANGITYYTGTVVVSDEKQETIIDRANAEITDFSSWGVPGSLLMKPEITAPGGEINSVWGTNQTNSGGTAGGSDQYELMSGTSMAAPHITGLSAVVAEYLRKNPVAGRNAELAEKYSTRAIIQSLLMSTATPMINDDNYVSILQQGAGLADVNAAVSAPSVLMMDDACLTTKTGAAGDGKVKVELGDDPARGGRYTYSFTLYNLEDDNLNFELSSDFFTQAAYGSGDETFMNQTTTPLGANVTYYWVPVTNVDLGHDVNRDGKTDVADAQAILDKVTGVISGEETANEDAWNWAVGDLDPHDERLTSYDAYLLLQKLQESSTVDKGVVPAHSFRQVIVTVDLTGCIDESVYTSGAYIEGFTSATGTTKDGATHTHSIPVLGFYGSWTDPSMFDNMSYVDNLYGAKRIPYTGNVDTNYLTVTYNGTATEFSGNPYMVEDQFPVERLAINSSSTIQKIRYNLYRAAGTTGYAVSKVDHVGGNVTDIIDATLTGTNIDGIWYSQSSGTWQNFGTKTYSVNKTPANYGLKEDDTFRLGFYAIPEYNGMLVNNSYNDTGSGMLNEAGFKTLLQNNTLGKGAFVGYDFTVDDTAPELDEPTLIGDMLTIAASDNQNLAYVAVMSLDGETVYTQKAPGVDAYAITMDISEAKKTAKGYVAVFAGDYAGNEVAVAVKVNDNIEGDPYQPASITLTPDSLDLYKGNTADLVAKVMPMTANDRTVSWSSSNNSVATVDANGKVTAVANGTATITATANDNNAVKASCTVNVLSLNKTLNGIIWDEEGGVYFSSFNDSSLPNWTKSHQTAKSEQLASAFMQSTTKLYAATLDTSNATTTLYTVNRSNYALTKYSENYTYATDMAIGASNTTNARYVGMVYTHGPVVVGGPIVPGSDGQGGSYSGLPYAFLDCSDTTGGAFLAGIACKSRSYYGGTYYILDENGVIWETTLGANDAGDGFEFSTPTLVVDTGIGTSFLYQNLYFNGTYLYWGHRADNIAELIIINPTNGKVYHAGNFGEGVWPATGFYTNGKVAPASVDDGEPMELGNLQPVATRDELMTTEIMERFANECERWGLPAPEFEREDAGTLAVEEPAPVDGEPVVEVPAEPVDEAPAGEDIDPAFTGSLTAAKGTVSATRRNSGSAAIQAAGNATVNDDDTVTIALSETKPSTNGVISIIYDSSVLTYQGTTSEQSLTSVFNDDENGSVITFAYASENLEPIPAGETLATITFKEKNPGSRATIKLITLERGDKLDYTESSMIIIPQPKFKTHSLTLSGKIGVNFYMDLSMLNDKERASSYMTFEITSQGKDEIDRKDPFDSGCMNASRKYYGFTAYVNSLQMAETLCATYHYIPDGMTEEVTIQEIYAIKDYFDGYDLRKTSFSPETQKLIESVADYGHYVQPFLADARDFTIGTDYAEMDKFYTAAADYDLSAINAAVSQFAIQTTINSADIEKISQSLLLDSGTGIRVYFKMVSSGYNGTFKATLDGKPVNASRDGGRYYVEFDDIAAHELGDRHTIIVTTDAGSAEVHVCALSYVKAVLDASTKDIQLNAVAALYHYYKATIDYYATIS